MVTKKKKKQSVVISSYCFLLLFYLYSLPCFFFKLLQSKSGQGPQSLEPCATDESVISHRTTININQSQSQNIFVNGGAQDTPNTDDAVEFRNNTAEIDDSNVNFNQNREQWQRRANSHAHTKLLKSNRHSETWVQRQNHTPDLVMDLPLVGSSSPKEITKKSISVLANLYSDRSEDDTVSVKSLESPTGPESPDMTTAAERFAKQNQCTLKKNTKIQSDSSGGSMEVTKQISDLVAISSPMTERKYNTLPDSAGSTTTTFKPQVKAKPPVLKKPVFSVPLPATPQEALRKDENDLT